MKFNIGMIGPSAAGKTSLMTAMFLDMKNHLQDDADTENHVFIEFADSETKDSVVDAMARFDDCVQMEKFIAWPRSKQASNFKFNVQFDFDGYYKSFGFDIMDYPGGLLTNPDEFARVCLPHIRKCCAIFVPIDTVALMRYAELSEIHSNYAESILAKLEIERVHEVINQWAAENCKNARRLFFVPVKTETYFPDSDGFSKDRSQCLRQLVEELYINRIADRCRDKSIEIVYNPVDTYGCVSLISAQWDDQNKVLKEEFSVCREASKKIKGAVDLFSIVLKSQLEGFLSQAKKTTEDGRSKIANRGVFAKMYYFLFPDPVKDEVAVSANAMNLYGQAIDAVSGFSSTDRIEHVK